MSLVKKYGMVTVLTSHLFMFSLSAHAETAPTPPSTEIINISPSPEFTPDATSTPDDIESIKKEKEEIKKITEPKIQKPKATATPKTNPVVQKKITTKVQVKKEEPKKPATPVVIKSKPGSKFVLQPGKVTASTYTAQKGDNLYTLSRKFNIRYKSLLAMNGVTSPYLIIGQKVIIDKSMQPVANFDGIVVNIPERKLYHFYKGKLQNTYPVSVGLPSPKWQTPVGNYNILYKVKDPVWKVPLSIQKEMAERGQVVKKEVPAGPGNPLGKWWMGLTWTGLGIHSTNAPLSVGYSVSHGCIRMRPTNAAELWNKIKTNTPVKVIYQPVKLSVDDKNHVFVEVFRDIYGRTPDMTKYAKTIINEFSLNPHIDWQKVNYALRNKRGISTQVSKNL